MHGKQSLRETNPTPFLVLDGNLPFSRTATIVVDKILLVIMYGDGFLVYDHGYRYPLCSMSTLIFELLFVQILILITVERRRSTGCLNQLMNLQSVGRTKTGSFFIVARTHLRSTSEADRLFHGYCIRRRG